MIGIVCNALACSNCQLDSGSPYIALFGIYFHMATLPLFVPAAIIPLAAEYEIVNMDSDAA